MDPNSFDYDRSDIHLSYAAARRLPTETMQLWMKELSEIAKGKIDHIIDLGCGTGRFTASLQQTFKAEVIGVDPSEKMLEVARAKVNNKNVEFAVGSA